MGAGCEAKAKVAVVLLCDGVLCGSACAVMAAAHMLVSWSSGDRSSSSSAGGRPKAALTAAAVVHQMRHLQ
jgi:hypothetical protein